MVRLKVIVIGTSPAETLRTEDALSQAAGLESFRYIGLAQALDCVPDWGEWSLIIARHSTDSADALLSLLAPVLRESSPPVFFLIDPYDPMTVTRLLNAGAVRVLPAECMEEVLAENLQGVFSGDLLISTGRQGPGNNGKGHGIGNPAESLFRGDGFSQLFHSSPIGISINRLSDGLCLDCNRSFASLLDWPREELIGRSMPELALPAGLKNSIFPAASSDTPRAQSALQFERKIYTRQQQIRHVQVSADLIEWSGEACTISVVQDITEKEQAKEKIKRLNDELERLVLVRTGALEAANRELAAEISRRAALESFSNQLSQVLWETPDVVSICAPDGRMQFLNKSGRALFGLGEDEQVTHLDLFSAYTQEASAWVRENVQPQVMRDGIWRGETVFQGPGGRQIPVSQVMVCKKDAQGAVQYYGFVARDVTDFKRVEMELRHSRERYRNLAEAAHDLIFMVSRDGHMEYANGFACEVLGFDPDSVEGMPAAEFFPQDFAAHHLRLFDEVNEIDRAIYTEGPFALDGQEFWMGTWLVPIHGETGGLVSVLGISRDITEQKKTDEALQRALQNERKLNEMRSNFFSMTSHQFRTPLNTILLSADLLQKYGARLDEEKRGEHLARIQDAARRLNSMLEDILVIGRAESGRYVSTPRNFDLIGMCEQQIYEMTVNDRNEHQVSFTHEMPSLPVYQDAEVMQRVLDNLLSNALKYSPKGSTIAVTARLEGRHVLLEVADQGIGIPERDMKYLFQPFHRASNAGDIPGTGIGLTIIQKSVELMNGSVSLKSQEGQGTTFMVRFPVRYEEAK